MLIDHNRLGHRLTYTMWHWLEMGNQRARKLFERPEKLKERLASIVVERLVDDCAARWRDANSTPIRSCLRSRIGMSKDAM